MNICIFDTETTSLDKPFCYNIGYVIVDTDSWRTLIERSYIVEQIWHNLPLFQSAYYANKREIYVADMRARKTIMDKFGYICSQMRRDFKAFNITMAFAYNSNFDEKVFNFNCDWYKCINPFDEVEIKDIRGFAHQFIVDNDYKTFCDENNLYTDTGNYSTTAEAMFRYIINDMSFNEEHTALEDSKIESLILRECVNRDANLNDNYTAFRSIERGIEKELHIRTVEQTDYYFKYTQMRINKGKTEITLKQKQKVTAM